MARKDQRLAPRNFIPGNSPRNIRSEIYTGYDVNKAHYRKDSDDYYIQVEGVAMYITPQDKGLLICANPAAEKALTNVFGAPTGRNSPDSVNYAEWRILK